MNDPNVDAEFVLVHQGYVQRLARSLVFDETMADDLAQQVWLSALQHPPVHGMALRGWLATIARNLASSTRRGAVRREARDRMAARPEQVVAADELVAREQLRASVVQAVLALDEPFRETIILRYFDDLPPRAIAARHGVPIATVKSRLKRGLATLRERLDRGHGGRAAWCLAFVHRLGAEPPAASLAAFTVQSLATGVVWMSVTKKLGVAALVLITCFLGWRALSPDKLPDPVVDEPELLALAPVLPAEADTPDVEEASRIPVTALTNESPAAAPRKVHDLYWLHVEARDTSGNPVCGVELDFYLRNPGSITEVAGQRMQSLGTTGANGVGARMFAFTKLAHGIMDPVSEGERIVVPHIEPVPEGSTRILVHAAGRGFGRREQEFVLDLSQQVHELSMEVSRGLTLFGRVSYSDGTPCADARLDLGLTPAWTNGMGEIITVERCGDIRITRFGVSGSAPGTQHGFRIRSPKPEYGDHHSQVQFEQSDLEVNVVLYPTKRILLTVTDCETGEPIQSPVFDVQLWRGGPDSPPAFVDSERVSFSGVLRDLDIHLRRRDATHLTLKLENCISRSVVLPPMEIDRIDAPATPIEVCVQPVNPISMEAILPDGSRVRRFRVHFEVNRLIGAWGTSTDFDAGPAFDISQVLTARPGREYAERPIESVEITSIQCISPDLRLGTLTDLEGGILAPPKLHLGETGKLTRPISLMAGPRSSSPTSVEKLSFRILPPD